MPFPPAHIMPGPFMGIMRYVTLSFLFRNHLDPHHGINVALGTRHFTHCAMILSFFLFSRFRAIDHPSNLSIRLRGTLVGVSLKLRLIPFSPSASRGMINRRINSDRSIAFEFIAFESFQFDRRDTLHFVLHFNYVKIGYRLNFIFIFRFIYLKKVPQPHHFRFRITDHFTGYYHGITLDSLGGQWFRNEQWLLRVSATCKQQNN